MANSDIVSQDELNALLNILNEDNNLVSENKSYEFDSKPQSRIEKFKDLIKISNNFATKLTTTIKDKLDKKIEISFNSILENENSYQQDKDIFKFNFEINSFQTDIKIFLSRMTINSIIDLYLGGEGIVDYQNQKYSKIELKIFNHFLEDISSELNLSWKSIAKMEKSNNITFNKKFIEIKFDIFIVNQAKTFILQFNYDEIDYLLLKNQIDEPLNLDKIEKSLKKFNFLDLEMNFIALNNFISLENFNSLEIGSQIKMNNYKKDKIDIHIGQTKIFMAKKVDKKIVIKKIAEENYES